MARSDTYATPIENAAAPYVARTVVTSVDAGKLQPLIVAPPNADLRVTSLGAWGNDTAGGFPHFGIIPPSTVKDANGFYDKGTDSFYACYSLSIPIAGVIEDDQVGLYPGSLREVAPSVWIIPAGWTLCVGSSITPNSPITYTVSAIYQTTYQTSNFEG
tara:strand:- start:2602 stop:3078 length:477 start_codon:yes stop_codon:yes gene_type:complete